MSFRDAVSAVAVRGHVAIGAKPVLMPSKDGGSRGASTATTFDSTPVGAGAGDRFALAAHDVVRRADDAIDRMQLIATATADPGESADLASQIELLQRVAARLRPAE